MPVIQTLGTMSARGEGMFHSPFKPPVGYIRNNTEVTYWLVPDGITSVCVLLVGGGGAGGANYGSGGGGGATTYVNNWPVTPGKYLEIGVGLGGKNVSTLSPEIFNYGGQSWVGVWNPVAPSTTKVMWAFGGRPGVDASATVASTAGAGGGAGGYGATGGYGGSCINTITGGYPGGAGNCTYIGCQFVGTSGIASDGTTVITGSLGGPVWGSNPYTNDSNFAAAAVHAGLLQVGETGIIKFSDSYQWNDSSQGFYKGDYIGSTRNGVASAYWTTDQGLWCGQVISLVKKITLYAGGTGATASGGIVAYSSGAGGDGGASFDGKVPTYAAKTVTAGIPTGGSGGWVLAKGGGGVGVFGRTLGVATPGTATTAGGSGRYTANGASGGLNGKVEGTGGDYGGGGAGSHMGSPGGSGAVRIMWGAGRSYPASLTADQPITATTGQLLVLPRLQPLTNTTETYNLTGPATVNEGDTATFVLTTTGVFKATITWNIIGSTVSPADITGGVVSGTIDIYSVSGAGSYNISFPITADQTTEGTETLLLKVYSTKQDPLTGVESTIVAASASCNVIDTSTSPPRIVFLPFFDSPNSWNEGTDVTINFATYNIPPRTTLNWYLGTYNAAGADAADFIYNNDPNYGGSGMCTATSGDINYATGSFILTIKADLLTEGTEYFNIKIQYRDPVFGIVNADSAKQTINDTSVPKSVTITGDTALTEGTAKVISVQSLGYPTGFVFNWIIGFQGQTASGSDFVNNQITGQTTATNATGACTLTLTAINDYITEPTETFQLYILDPSQANMIVASKQGNITDAVETVFRFGQIPTLVNEGNVYNFTIIATPAPATAADGLTPYMYIEGVGAHPVIPYPWGIDFVDWSNPSSTFLQNGLGGGQFTVKADYLTEGPETFRILVFKTQAKYNSYRASPSDTIPDLISPTITVVDTSITVNCTTFENTITVTGATTGGTVWGSNPYTVDSNFNMAAVHAGLVTPGQTRTLRKAVGDRYAAAGMVGYPGSVGLGGVVSQTSTDATLCGVILMADSQTLSGVCTPTKCVAPFDPAPGKAFRIVTTGPNAGTALPTIPYNIVGASGTAILIPEGRIDDTFDKYTLPFPITFLGQTYTDLYVGTNGYVTFTDGHTVYSTTTYDNPPLPKIMISVCDLANHRRYITTEGTAPNRTWRLRWEGRKYGDISPAFVGDYNISWEMTFYESPNNQIDLCIERNLFYV